MTEPLKPDDLALSELRGRITLPDPITGAPVRYVWQKTGRQFANQSTDQHPQLQLRVEPGGKKGDTPKQNAMRARMADAVVEWQALGPADKKTWAVEARRYGGRLSGYHLFLREKLRTD